MSLKNLPIRKLQDHLSDIPFEDLESILNEITGEERKISIFDDKPFLSKLFIPIKGADNLHKKSFREELLKYCEKEKIIAFCTKFNVKTDIPIEKMIAEILNLTWGPNEHTKDLIELLGFPTQYIPETPKKMDTVEEIIPHSKPFKQLKDFQSLVVFEGLKELSIPDNRYLIQMPTGTGKTRTAVEIICDYLNSDEDKTVLWFANREELCEQVIESFKETWVHLGKRKIKIFRCYGPHTLDFNLIKEGFVVAGFQKMWSLVKNNTIKFLPDIIFVDEAHMITAPTYKKTLDRLQSFSKGTIIIGLTATPGRSYTNWKENKELAEYFYNKIIGIDPPEDVGIITYLQNKGILSIPVRTPLYTNISFELTEKEWEELTKEYDYPKTLLIRIAQNYSRNLLISKKLKEIGEKGLKTLFFACSVEQSKMFCSLMVYLGFTAAHVDASTNPITRRDIIEKFKAGKNQFLFNYEIFTTGFDVPDIDAIFIARPTSSIVTYSQIIGRGMRGPAVGGTSIFYLIDVIDNINTFGRGLEDIYNFFSEYWGG